MWKYDMCLFGHQLDRFKFLFVTHHLSYYRFITCHGGSWTGVENGKLSGSHVQRPPDCMMSRRHLWTPAPNHPTNWKSNWQPNVDAHDLEQCCGHGVLCRSHTFGSWWRVLATHTLKILPCTQFFEGEQQSHWKSKFCKNVEKKLMPLSPCWAAECPKVVMVKKGRRWKCKS